MHKKAKAFLTMAGLTHNADTAQVKRDVAEVAQRAAGSKEAIAQGVAEKTFLDMETCKNIASSILGLNQGPDQVVEARIKADNRDQLGNDTMFSLYAFDRADFQILNGLIYKPQDGVLHIEALRASHGRNCEDFKLGLGKPKEPGRGNSAIIAAGLESIILEGSKCGIHRITTKPGSFKVAELYQKMGFRVEGHTEKVDKPQAAELMYLDLTNTDRLKDALLGFSLSRSMITDVPKDVTARMLADGQEAPQPSYQQVKRRTRRAQVVRLEE